MTFDPRRESIEALLTASRQYKVPRFQREFSWDRTNYKEFYLDILKQISFKEKNLR